MTTTPAPATQATAKPLTAPLSAALALLEQIRGIVATKENHP